MLKVPRLGPDDLILKGFFHDRIIPPLATTGLKDAVGDLVGLARKIVTLAAARNPAGAGDDIAEDAHGCLPLLRKYGVKFYDPERRWEGATRHTPTMMTTLMRTKLPMTKAKLNTKQFY